MGFFLMLALTALPLAAAEPRLIRPEVLPPGVSKRVSGGPFAVPDEPISVAVSPDGKRVALGFAESRVGVYQLPGGRCEALLLGAHSARLAFVGVRLACQTADRRGDAAPTQLWDLAAGTWSGLTVDAWQVSGDGTTLVGVRGPKRDTGRPAELVWTLAEADYKLVGIDPETGRETPIGTQRAAGLSALTLNDDGSRLAVGTGTGRVEVWDVPGRKALHGWKVEAGFVEALAFLPGRDRLAVARSLPNGNERWLELRAGVSGKVVQKFITNFITWTSRLLGRGDGTFVAVPADREAKMFGLDDARSLWVFAEKEKLFTADGRTLADLKIRPRRVSPQFDHEGRGPVAYDPQSPEYALQISPPRDPSRIWFGGGSLKWADGKLDATFDDRRPPWTVAEKTSPDSFDVALGGRRLLTRGNRPDFDGWPHPEESAQLWDLDSGTLLARRGVTGGRWPGGLRFAPGGESYALPPGDREAVLRLYETSTGGLRAAIPQEGGWEFSNDGRRIVTANPFGGVDLIELAPAPAKVPAASDLDAAWNDLRGADVAKAFAAIGTLSADPAEALKRVEAAVKDFPVATEKGVRESLALLGHSRDAVRASAREHLATLGYLPLRYARTPEERKLFGDAFPQAVVVAGRMMELLARLDTPAAAELRKKLAAGDNLYFAR